MLVLDSCCPAIYVWCVVSTTQTITTILRPLYRSACVCGHPHLISWGYCWCKVLLLVCPCWQQYYTPKQKKQWEWIIWTMTVAVSFCYIIMLYCHVICHSCHSFLKKNAGLKIFSLILACFFVSKCCIRYCLQERRWSFASYGSWVCKFTHFFSLSSHYILFVYVIISVISVSLGFIM